MTTCRVLLYLLVLSQCCLPLQRATLYCTSLSCRAHACLCSSLTSPSGLQSWAALLLINSSPPGRDLITPCGRTYLDSGSHTQFATTGTRQTLTTVPHPLVSLHCTTPGALLLPSPPFPLHAAPHPRATCLSDACIVTLPEALVFKKVPS